MLMFFGVFPVNSGSFEQSCWGEMLAILLNLKKHMKQMKESEKEMQSLEMEVEKSASLVSTKGKHIYFGQWALNVPGMKATSGTL